jgi:hypothetical protein
LRLLAEELGRMLAQLIIFCEFYHRFLKRILALFPPRKRKEKSAYDVTILSVYVCVHPFTLSELPNQFNDVQNI